MKSTRQVAIVVVLFYVAMAVAASTQTFTKLADASSTTGYVPGGPLVQGLDGNLYGTMSYAGASKAGTFFQLTPSGGVNVSYNFCSLAHCPDGAMPMGAVVLGPNGNFYGTTNRGGTTRDLGTVYQMTASGGLTTLHTFCAPSSCPDGANPFAGLILATGGNFYGTSSIPPNNSFNGEVFRVTASGKFHTVHTFCPAQVCAPGEGSFPGGLVQASNGNIFGVTPSGGNNQNPEGGTSGTLFRVSPSGASTNFYQFCGQSSCGDGFDPQGPLVQAPGGNFFGTTYFGGTGTGCEAVTQGQTGCGTAFKVTSAGTMTTLHTFCSQTNCPDGAFPTSLIQASDGNFYGMTASGGASVFNGGTIFRLTPGGTLTTLYQIIDTAAGTPPPTAALVQATNGTLYGVTSFGGANGLGMFFQFSDGLAPFVKTVQPAGRVGDSIIILGNGLTGSTSVTLNGATATFAVVSDTEITATVPTGATTGKIQVVTPGSTLTSNVPFRVF